MNAAREQSRLSNISGHVTPADCLGLDEKSLLPQGSYRAAGIRVLREELDLTGTKVTAGGVDQFRAKRAANPKIHPIGKSPTIRR